MPVKSYMSLVASWNHVLRSYIPVLSGNVLLYLKSSLLSLNSAYPQYFYFIYNYYSSICLLGSGISLLPVKLWSTHKWFSLLIWKGEIELSVIFMVMTSSYKSLDNWSFCSNKNALFQLELLWDSIETHLKVCWLKIWLGKKHLGGGITESIFSNWSAFLLLEKTDSDLPYWVYFMYFVSIKSHGKA